MCTCKNTCLSVSGCIYIYAYTRMKCTSIHICKYIHTYEICIYLQSFQLLAALLTTTNTYTLAGAWVRARSIFAYSLAHANVRDLCLCLYHSTHSHTHAHTGSKIRSHTQVPKFESCGKWSENWSCYRRQSRSEPNPNIKGKRSFVPKI